MMARVIALNRYTLRDAAGFEAAVAALVARVRSEGHPGVLDYHFYRAGPEEARAVVVYAGPEAWVGHHDIIMSWPEMAALRASADLAGVDLHGEVTDTMRDWIARMGLASKVRHLGEALAGFHRDGR